MTAPAAPAAWEERPQWFRFGPTEITVSVWHNVARDQASRRTAPLDGFTPGDPMVSVFTYQTLPRGRSPEAIAEDAFAAFNGHPRDAEGAALASQYYRRRLRSLCFPGKKACCACSCCSCELVMWLAFLFDQAVAARRRGVARRSPDRYGAIGSA
jgi:hypothetical protein